MVEPVPPGIAVAAAVAIAACVDGAADTDGKAPSADSGAGADVSPEPGAPAADIRSRSRSGPFTTRPERVNGERPYTDHHP